MAIRTFALLRGAVRDTVRAMPAFERSGVSIHYEVSGAGYPVLLLAPGGMRSSIAFWGRSPWNPVTELESRFQVVAMDQRNAGTSTGPIRPGDGWHTYADDQLDLLDYLGIERCHVLGGCIGGAFALTLAERAPDRITAAVLQQPIGLSDEADNREVFHQLFDGWADELRSSRKDMNEAALLAMRKKLYGGDFVFSVSREFVRACSVPLLVLRGNDVYHPSSVSEEIARLAPRAEIVPSWREGDDTARAVARVKAFLAEHTPT